MPPTNMHANQKTAMFDVCNVCFNDSSYDIKDLRFQICSVFTIDDTFIDENFMGCSRSLKSASLLSSRREGNVL